MTRVKLIVALTCAWGTAGAQAAGSATINVQNKCDKGQAYVILSTGSSLQTLLPPRTSKSTKLDHGDRIKVGGDLIHTVSAASEGKTVLVCSK